MYIPLHVLLFITVVVGFVVVRLVRNSRKCKQDNDHYYDV